MAFTLVKILHVEIGMASFAGYDGFIVCVGCAAKRTISSAETVYAQQLYKLKWIHSQFLDFIAYSFYQHRTAAGDSLHHSPHTHTNTHKQRIPIGAYVEHQPCVK